MHNHNNTNFHENKVFQREQNKRRIIADKWRKAFQTESKTESTAIFGSKNMQRRRQQKYGRPCNCQILSVTKINACFLTLRRWLRDLFRLFVILANETHLTHKYHLLIALRLCENAYRFLLSFENDVKANTHFFLCLFCLFASRFCFSRMQNETEFRQTAVYVLSPDRAIVYRYVQHISTYLQ